MGDADAKVPHSHPPRWLGLVALALGLLGAAYCCEGLLRALVGPMPQDLGRRWLENAYLVRRIDSMDVYAGAHAVEPDIGPAHPGGYPPWSMAVGLLVAPPLGQSWLRVYFALLNVAALAFVARYAAKLGARHGAPTARLFVASCLAVSANAVVLRHGQYGLLVNAMLVGTLGALGAERPVSGGVWLALAALKPQTSALFALLWLKRRGVVALLVAGVLCGAATAAVSLWVRASPLHLLGQVFGQAAEWEGGDAGLLRILLAVGVPRRRAILGLAALGVFGGAALLHRFRFASLEVRTAIVCVGARLWAYHRRYDDVMLIFLLLPLGVAALERPSRTGFFVYFAVGLTLWLPLREVDHGLPLIAVKVASWVFALAWLLRQSSGHAKDPVIAAR